MVKKEAMVTLSIVELKPTLANTARPMARWCHTAWPEGMHHRPTWLHCIALNGAQRQGATMKTGVATLRCRLMEN